VAHTTPATAKEYIEPSIAAENIFNLPWSPAEGGIPALGKSIAAVVTAETGFVLDNQLRSVMYFMHSSFLLILCLSVCERVCL
jgi:hypothetical protein